ncbi:MAG: glycosyltransferase family 4 protein [Paludibacteraceae bacterium]|nr:glycosyltransferase family 4 protein [Lachnospiraceae bacterium]MBR5822700.1 glycosyltransferase family 4 protein [Paludibacteraceae bacterium]
MDNNKLAVLILATSQKTRGGITSVVKAHTLGNQWKEYNCKWIETHIDTGMFMALWYLIKSYLQFLFHMPFAKIIHIHLSEPGSAIRKLLYFFPAHLFGKKTIVHFHAFSPDTTINGSRQWVYRYIFCRADRVVVLSNTWKNVVYEAFKNENIEVVYNPCTTNVSEKKYSKQKNILYAGAVNARKGYADMILAFAKIAHEYRDWNIVFAGNGEIEQGKALAKELGISNQCIFLGWVNGEQKDKAFKEASIFCLPSYAEGFPMAVLDAWSYGLPVITTPVGGIPDVAKNEENMLVFNPGDIEKLSECMRRLITDEILYDRIKKASIDFAENKFSLKEINAQIGNIYKELVK